MFGYTLTVFIIVIISYMNLLLTGLRLSWRVNSPLKSALVLKVVRF